MDTPIILLNAARCRACGVLLVSETRHSYVSCACGNAVDGGRDYIKRGFSGAGLEELSVYRMPNGSFHMGELRKEPTS